MATIDVKDATGATVAIEKPLVPARAAAAASRPVVLSTEDLAVLNAILAAVGDASEATSIEIRDKLIAAPATEAKQTSSEAVLSAINTVLGEVDVAPTANTIADRLLALATAIAAGNAILQDIEDQGDAPGAVPVDVETVPADPFGLNADAVVAAGAAGSISAKLRRLTTDVAAVTTAINSAAAASIPAGTASIGGAKDNGPHWTSVFGVSGAAFVSADASTAVAVTDAPTGGQKLVITDIWASSDTAMNLEFEIETAGTIIFKAFVPANGSVQITPRSKCKLATADKKLMVDASVAGNISVTVFYYSEA